MGMYTRCVDGAPPFHFLFKQWVKPPHLTLHTLHQLKKGKTRIYHKKLVSMDLATFKRRIRHWIYSINIASVQSNMRAVPKNYCESTGRGFWKFVFDDLFVERFILIQCTIDLTTNTKFQSDVE